LKLPASVIKELTLLYRDLAGLLVLFVMPVVLVVVVTLVQENVSKLMGEDKTAVLFVDMDGQSVGPMIEESLRKSASVKMVTEINGRKADVDTAKMAVAKGDFQMSIIVPYGITEVFRKTAKQRAKNSFSIKDGRTKKAVGVVAEESTHLLVYFDPTLKELYRSGMVNALQKMLLALETEERIKGLSDLLPKEMEMISKKAMGNAWSEEFRNAIPSVRLDWDNRPIINVEEKTAMYGDTAKAPTTVQQNVPAWTLFGMFFVVVPLGASLIRERQDGVMARLLTMPISYITIISGKVIAYTLICMIQFGLILAVGKMLLPLLGTPALDMGSSPESLMLIALASGLAAAGYGILLGTVARTYEQASTLGAVSVVIAAALGGVMVPSYVMPHIMQKIGMFSPLSWGLNAFLTIFVRGGGIKSIFPEIGSMFLFFVLTICISWFYMFQRGRFRAH
jgi:ABC-2 type transport system permease protein